MGIGDQFTVGRSADEWLRWIYEQSVQSAAKSEVDLPSYGDLQEKGWHKVDAPSEPHDMLAGFRLDPDKHPLETPSGKIEIYSSKIANFDYPDCPGHPTWMEPKEWLGTATRNNPLHLISNQPANKLHSQLDHGKVSRDGKIHNRETILINSENAASRGICNHDVVRVFNTRGACLAVAVLSDDILTNVVQMSTGAWLDATLQDDGTLLCHHGNPNLLTLDKGTSRLAQGPTAHSCLVNIEKFHGELSDIQAFNPPKINEDYNHAE
jgi:biotin/methionine sulfoxide reductase